MVRSLFVVCVVAWVAGSARGQAPPVELATRGCPGLDDRELLRLLAIELSAVQSAQHAIQAPTVDVHCQAAWIRLTLVDRDSGGYLDRVIPAPAADDPARERLVALAASQLVMAWLPRSDAPPAPQAASEPVAPTPPGASSPVATPQVAEPLADTEPAAASISPDSANSDHAETEAAIDVRGETVLSLRGGGRIGDMLDDPAPLASAGLLASYGFAPRWLVLAVAEFATGQASRTVGVVDVQTASFGAGVRLVVLQRSSLRFDLDATLAARYVHLGGELQPELRQLRGSSASDADGVGADVALSFGPSMETGPMQIAAKLCGGVTAGGPLGRVQGDHPVARAGPWLGLGLELGVHVD